MHARTSPRSRPRPRPAPRWPPRSTCCWPTPAPGRCGASCPGCPASSSPPGSCATPARSSAAPPGLAAELTRVGLGRSRLAPAEKDRRFTEEAWARNPLFKRTLQGYLAARRGRPRPGRRRRPRLGRRPADPLHRRQPGRGGRPQQQPVPQPQGPQAHPRHRRRQPRRGRPPASCATSRPRRGCPRWSRPTPSRSARTSRSRPGAVVLRTDVFELIQYTPQTPQVRTVPVLIVPPTINKYYVIDLAEQRSLVEHLVQTGQQVFCISWRNPDVRHADWGLDTYGQAILEAMTACEDITAPGQDRDLRHLLRRHDRLDGDGPPRRHRRAGPRRGVQPGGDGARPGAGRGDQRAALAQVGGRLDAGVEGEGLPRRAHAGRDLRLAAAQRPDLELLGQQLPDGPRPQGLRHPLLERRPGADDRRRCTATSWTSRSATRWSSPARPRCSAPRSTCGEVTTDSYVVAGIADHLCKWESCYQTTQLLRRRHQVRAVDQRPHRRHGQPARQPQGQLPDLAVRQGQQGTDNPADAASGSTRRVKVKGSWWDDWMGWLAERTRRGEDQAAPARATRSYEPLATRPGTYVHDR